MERRSFLRGLVAMPAVVAAGSIMPVKLWSPVRRVAYPTSESEFFIVGDIFTMRPLGKTLADYPGPEPMPLERWIVRAVAETRVELEPWP